MAFGFVHMGFKLPLYVKSYYCCDLKSRQAWILNGQDFKGDLKWYLKSGQIAAILSKNI